MVVYCMKCGKRFTRKDSLQRHMATVHVKPDKNRKLELTCGLCDESITTSIGKHKCKRKQTNDNELNKRFKHTEELNNDTGSNVSNKETEESDSNDDTEELNDNESDVSSNQSSDTEESDGTDESDRENVNRKRGKKILEIYQCDRENETDKTESETEINEGMDSVKKEQSNFFEHDLFDVIETPEEMRNIFKYCKNLITFRIHPSPVPMSCTKKYLDWMNELFNAILEYCQEQYTSSVDDLIKIQMYHTDHPTKVMCVCKRRKDLNENSLAEAFCGEQIPPPGDLTIHYQIVKNNNTCESCNHKLQ